MTQYILSSILFFTGIGLFVFILIFGKQKRLLENKYLTLLFLSTAIYTLSYAMEILGNSVAWMMMAIRIEYFGISFIPPLLILMSLKFVRRERGIPLPLIIFLFLISFITLFTALTTEKWGWLYKKVTIDYSGPFPMLSAQVGFWYYIHVIYTQLAGLFACVLFLRAWIFSASRNRHIAAIMFLGSLIPFVGFLIYLLKILPFPLDITPLTMSASIIIFYIAIFKFDFVRIAPIARDYVFEWMKDVVLVLDDQNNIIDYNHAAFCLLFDRKKIPLKYAKQTIIESISEAAILFTESFLDSKAKHWSMECPEINKLMDQKKRKHRAIISTLEPDVNDLTSFQESALNSSSENALGESSFSRSSSIEISDGVQENTNSEEMDYTKLNIKNSYYSAHIIGIQNRKRQFIGKIIVLHDITQHEKMTKMLQSLATTDELTKLYNRRHFMDLTRRELERTMRYKRSFSIGIIDLDYFKKVNDQFGHAAGDRVLHTVATLCHAMLRGTDIIGRYGGEEFVLCLPETDQNGSKIIAERLRSMIANRPILVNDEQSISVTASFGFYTVDLTELNDNSSLKTPIAVEEIFKKADQALYRAKELGRNRIEVY